MNNAPTTESAAEIADKPLPPNDEFFPQSDTGLIARGQAQRDPKTGVWRNAIGLESSPMFRHVAKVWQAKCIPFQQFYDTVRTDDRKKRDVVQKPNYFREIDDELVLPDGATVTPNAIRHLIRQGRLPSSLSQLATMAGGAYKAQVAYILRGQLERTMNGEDYYTRYRTTPVGETLCRAVFKQRWLNLLDNFEVLDILRESFPAAHRNGEGWGNALASHIQEDFDSMTGNLIFPDYMKQQPDSEYGVGIAFRNSEVTEGGGMEISAFLFRAICLNGCIWSRRNSAIRVIEEGKESIDYRSLKAKIQQVVDIALSEGHDLLTRMGYTYEIPVPSPEKVIAFLAREHALTQEQSRTWYHGYQTETIRDGAPFKQTAFGVVQGLTRAAQCWQGDSRQRLEGLASALVAKSLTDDIDAIARRWGKWNEDASTIKEETVRTYCLVGTARA